MKFEDILYEKKEGVAKITINRPQVYNAFRTQTMRELVEALDDAGADPTIGVVVLTGAGNKAFCTGGDATEAAGGKAGYSPDMARYTPRVHQLIREMPKPVIAAVNGYAVGGGHVLHVICDLSIASENARFAQVGPRVGSFDCGFGAGYLTRVVGEKKAREIWYLCRQYTAKEALEMGLVNKVVPPDKLEEEVNTWCKEILAKSPTAIKCLKTAFAAQSAYLRGWEDIGYDAVWMYYQTDEAQEGRNAFKEKRAADFNKFRQKE